jgi:hypothetical protein
MLVKLVTTPFTSLSTVVTAFSGSIGPQTTTIMPQEHDNNINAFLHPSIPPILGIPSYSTIAELHLKLNANAASVFSSLGDGSTHGLLALTVSDTIYNMPSATPFVHPVNPGPQPIIPAGATGPQILAITRDHTKTHQIWKEYLTTDKNLKQQILAAVNETYYCTLRNQIMGFANVTTCQLIKHLYKTHGNIMPADLIENDKCMKAAYDPSQPIEVLFDQIEEAVDLADSANAAYTISQIVAIAYNSVFQTRLFADACREWRHQQSTYKTWTTCKTNFALAHQELPESQVTSQSTGFHLANLAYKGIQQDTANTLANLATATASDRSTISQLSTTNSQLSVQLQETSHQLGQALNDITALKRKIESRETTMAHQQDNHRAINNDDRLSANGLTLSTTAGRTVIMYPTTIPAPPAPDNATDTKLQPLAQTPWEENFGKRLNARDDHRVAVNNQPTRP